MIFIEHYQTENNNEIDMIVMFKHERLIKEFLFTDYKILMIFRFDIPFRKM